LAATKVLLGDVHIGHVEAEHLGDAEAGVEDEVDQGRIPLSLPALRAVHGPDQAALLLGREDVGSRPSPMPQPEGRGRVGLDEPGVVGPAEERLEARLHLVDRAGCLGRAVGLECDGAAREEPGQVPRADGPQLRGGAEGLGQQSQVVEVA